MAYLTDFLQIYFTGVFVTFVLAWRDLIDWEGIYREKPKWKVFDQALAGAILWPIIVPFVLYDIIME